VNALPVDPFGAHVDGCVGGEEMRVLRDALRAACRRQLRGSPPTDDLPGQLTVAVSALSALDARVLLELHVIADVIDNGGDGWKRVERAILCLEP
jgi:hypothetical protein